jgi:hypothetical protein
MLSNKLPVSIHVRVSEAHVVVIVDQSSAKLGFAWFVKLVVGFEVFVII